MWSEKEKQLGLIAKSEIGRQLNCLKNIFEGYQIATRVMGRKSVESLEVACFVLFLNEISGFTPEPIAVAHVFRIQDVIERQNRHGDESKSWGEDSANPYWEHDHFAGEFAEITTSILQDLIFRYGNTEGRKRAAKIDNALERWFFVSRAVEQKIRGKPLEEFTKPELTALGQLANNEIDNPARCYREQDDQSWLNVVINVATDVDETLINRHFETIFGAVLLLQLADDFANIGRNRRTNKIAFFSHGPTSLKEEDPLIKKLKMLLKHGSFYLEKIDIPKFQKEIARLIWLSRSIFTHIKTEMRDDNHYSNDEFVRQCNVFEKRIAERFYNE